MTVIIALFFVFLIIVFVLGLWLWFRAKKKIQLSLFADESIARKSIVIDGFNISYIEMGRGRPLVLIHGLGASMYCYRFLIKPLARSFRVIALDLPGFGASQKIPGIPYDIDHQVVRVADFLRALQLNNVGLIGSSMGGRIAFLLAKRQPQMVRFVVGLAPALIVQTRLPSLLVLRSHTFVQKILGASVMRQVLKLVVARHELINQEMINMYLEPFKDPLALRIVFEALTSLRSSQVTEELYNLNAPCLLLWGQADKILSVRLMQTLKIIFSGATIAIHPKAGHHIQEDDPGWVCEQIVKFSQQTS